jgi:UrcA family protein
MKRILLAAVCGVAVAASAYAADEVPGVTVKGSRLVSEPVGKNSTGIPIQDVSLTMTVKYGDLDVATPAGKASLETRVTSAARKACAEINRLYPLGSPSEVDCVRKAVKEAMAQVK